MEFLSDLYCLGDKVELSEKFDSSFVKIHWLVAYIFEIIKIVRFYDYFSGYSYVTMTEWPSKPTEIKLSCSSHLAWPKYRKFSIFDIYIHALRYFSQMNPNTVRVIKWLQMHLEICGG
jgi:hypothetical protein